MLAISRCVPLRWNASLKALLAALVPLPGAGLPPLVICRARSSGLGARSNGLGTGGIIDAERRLGRCGFGTDKLTGHQQ